MYTIEPKFAAEYVYHCVQTMVIPMIGNKPAGLASDVLKYEYSCCYRVYYKTRMLL